MLERLLLLDAALRAWATTHHAPWADVLMAALSDVGRGGLIWLVIGATAAVRRPPLRPLLWQVCLAILLAHVTIDLALKPLIARSRPFVVIHDARVAVARPSTYSFPSGHAASAAAGAFVTTLMLPRVRALLWALAALIALSRIYVGRALSPRCRLWRTGRPGRRRLGHRRTRMVYSTFFSCPTSVAR